MAKKILPAEIKATAATAVTLLPLLESFSESAGKVDEELIVVGINEDSFGRTAI